MTLRMPMVMVVLLLLGSGCAARPGGPLLGGSTIERTGMVSGTVRATAGEALGGRRISAIDIRAADAHYDATTALSGRYTIEVPASRYRLEVELRGGEVIVTQPSQTNVNAGDLDAQLDFVIRR